MKAVGTTALVAALFSIGQPADANCRQALAMGLDVSGSVDLREYRLQLDGLVSALNNPEVVDALLAVPGAPVALMIYEWSGPTDQLVLVPWTYVYGPQQLAEISARLATTERRAAEPGTALGTAMAIGARFLEQKRGCWKRTLDISGDGHSNLGPRPRNVKSEVERSGVTINALVIGADSIVGADRRQSDIAELTAYFEREVIVGPDAFVQTAIGFEDYENAMTAKLRRELQGAVIGRLQIDQ